MSARHPEERAAAVLIGGAAFAVLVLAAYHLGADAGRPEPLP